MRGEKILCVIVVVLFFVMNMVMAEAQLNDRYTREAVVVEVQGHTVTAEDTTGNLWYYDVEGDTVPQVGTRVVLTMLAMGSDTIYDDRVVDVE